jgi:hypothetical protein
MHQTLNPQNLTITVTIKQAVDPSVLAAGGEVRPVRGEAMQVCNHTQNPERMIPKPYRYGA